MHQTLSVQPLHQILSVQPHSDGIHQVLSCVLTQGDFAFTKDDMQMRLQRSVQTLYAEFEGRLRSDSSDDVKSLDPTQLVAYQLLHEWADKRQAWCQSQSLAAPPSLHLLLLGTAGTGKTLTAKLAIAKARRTFGSFHSVLTVAYSGVAAANLGDGARTVDNTFSTQTQNTLRTILRGRD